jgi:hypothetical protein
MARRYVEANPDLAEAIVLADRLSASTGIHLVDAVILHRAVRALRPATVLECGTGKSTFVLAAALASNSGPGTPPRLVSMEHNQEWYEQAARSFPRSTFPFVEIVHSPETLYGYSFVRGTAYREVPDLPYDLVFVDGPGQGLFQDHPYTMCNLDFVRLVEKSDRPIRAIVDNRKHTVLAYTVIFGPAKVRFFAGGSGQGSLGIVAGVTKSDLLLGDKPLMRRTLFPQFVRTGKGDPVRFLVASNVRVEETEE